MRRPTLVISNDFPPRIGGIESFVAQACTLLEDNVVVLTSTAPGADLLDAGANYPVVRLPGPLLPTNGVGRTAVELLRKSGADRVLFGAAAPLALLAPRLRAAGAVRIVAISHGHETWWARLPGFRALLRRIGDHVDVLTTISDFTTERIARALSPAGRSKLVRLSPPVDFELFHPLAPAAAPGIVKVVAAGRMVPRKGFDTLLGAWELLNPATREMAELVLVGDGPQRRRLESRARRTGADKVRFTGKLDRAGVASQLRSADIFAFPARTRKLGLEPEGLGLAALEAAACGLPVLVGNSGGAPETVRDGQTGFVVDPRRAGQLADRLTELIHDRSLRQRLGSAGVAFVADRHGPAQARQRLLSALY